MAILAAYANQSISSLADFLTNQVFVENQGETLMATPAEIASFQTYTKAYKNCLEVEALASNLMK